MGVEASATPFVHQNIPPHPESPKLRNFPLLPSVLPNPFHCNTNDFWIRPYQPRNGAESVAGLHLLNGDTGQRKIQDGNLIGRRLEEGKTADDMVGELCLLCLMHRTNELETVAFKEMLAEAEDQKLFLEDTFWALLNSCEFLFNH